MDPYGEISRDCVLSISQEEDLRGSLFVGESIDGLATISTGEEEELPGEIPECSTGIFMCSPPHDSEEEDEGEGEEANAHQESPPGVRQMSAEKTLDKSPPGGAQQMYEENILDNLNEGDGAAAPDDGDAGVVNPAVSKRKSTVEMRSGCSSGSRAKKTRFSIAESRDIGILKLKGDSSGTSVTPPVEIASFSVDLELSKGKSPAEKDLGFFEKLKSRFFTGKSLDLGLPGPRGDSSVPLSIHFGDDEPNAVSATAGVGVEVCQSDGDALGLVERSSKQSHDSGKKSPPVGRDPGISRSKGDSSGKSMVSETPQGIDNVGDGNAAVSKGKSPVKKDLGFSKSKRDSSRKSIASDVSIIGGDADPAVVPKGKSPAKGKLVLSKSRGYSSSEFAAKASKNLQKSVNLTLPEVLPSDGRSPRKRNKITPDGKSPAKKDLRFSKSPEKFPSKSPAKAQLSKPAEEISNALKDSRAKQARNDPRLAHPPSDVCHDMVRDPPGKDAGLTINAFAKFRWNESSNPRKHLPLKLLKEALGISKTSFSGVSKTSSTEVHLPRKLPASIQGPPDENAGGCNRGGKPTSRLKRSERSNVGLLDIAKVFSKESDHSIGDESILEVAKRAGYVFPQPRWWHPEGYSKT